MYIYIYISILWTWTNRHFASTNKNSTRWQNTWINFAGDNQKDHRCWTTKIGHQLAGPGVLFCKLTICSSTKIGHQLAGPGVLFWWLGLCWTTKIGHQLTGPGVLFCKLTICSTTKIGHQLACPGVLYWWLGLCWTTKIGHQLAGAGPLSLGSFRHQNITPGPGPRRPQDVLPQGKGVIFCGLTMVRIHKIGHQISKR